MGVRVVGKMKRPSLVGGWGKNNSLWVMRVVNSKDPVVGSKVFPQHLGGTRSLDFKTKDNFENRSPTEKIN